MNAAYSYVLCYKLTAKCISPLRVSDAEGNPQEILCSGNGTPFIQGSSLAGAMRSWISENLSENDATVLFGSLSSCGQLIVSDGLFTDAEKVAMRPRVRIDSTTGCCVDGGKFDFKHVVVGAEFIFSLTWLGEEATSTKAAEKIEKILSAINCGQISFGAQKNNGFGRTKLASAKKYIFDLRKSSDLDLWLNDDAPSPSDVEFKEIQPVDRVVFTLTGKTDSLLVKSSGREMIKADTSSISVTKNICEDAGFILPGSSIKGAVRDRISFIIRRLGLDRSIETQMFGSDPDENDGVAGCVRFEDIILSNVTEQLVTRIHINRITGGVMRKGTFNESPVAADIVTSISMPASNAAACGLMLYALRDLAMGMYNLGSGWAIGRGFISADKLDIYTPQGPAEIRFHKNRVDNAGVNGQKIISEWLTAVNNVKKKKAGE